MKSVVAWLANLRYAVGVSAVIFDARGRVLLLKHTYRRANYEWGLPGGWAKGRESVERALTREMLEETGFAITIDRLVAVHSGYAVPRITILFLAHVTGGTFCASDEVSAFEYCDPDALLRILPAERMAVRQAMAVRDAIRPA